MPAYGQPVFGSNPPQEGRLYFRTQLQTPSIELFEAGLTTLPTSQYTFDLTSGNMSQVCGVMVDNSFNPNSVTFVVQDSGYTFKVRPHEFYQGPFETGGLTINLTLMSPPNRYLFEINNPNFSYPINFSLLNFEPPTRRRAVGPIVGALGYYSPLASDFRTPTVQTASRWWIVSQNFPTVSGSSSPPFPSVLIRNGLFVSAFNDDSVLHNVAIGFGDQNGVIANYPADIIARAEIPAGSSKMIFSARATKKAPIPIGPVFAAIDESYSILNSVFVSVSDWAY